MKLTDTQLVLLSAAAQRQDGAVELGSKLKGGAGLKVIDKLLREQLVEEIPATDGLPVWRRDDQKGALALRITEGGLAAIGAGQGTEEGTAEAPPQKRGTKRPTSRGPGRSAPRKPAREARRKPATTGHPDVEAGGGDRHAAGPARCDRRGHHEGDRLATALGARLLRRGGAQEARPDAGVGEDRRQTHLPDQRQAGRRQRQEQARSQGRVTRMSERSPDREAVEAEIDRIRSLGLDDLRVLWRTTFRSSPPQGFTKDLVVRFICWHIQEQAFGGLDPATAKVLDGLARGNKVPDRRLKAGTVLVREYQGERHTVTVVPNGYVWREGSYASLSTIARAITGTAWNGPRFFGLRTRSDEPKHRHAAMAERAPRTRSGRAQP